MSYGTGVTPGRAVRRRGRPGRAALQEQGSGVLTETDVTTTMRAKLGEQMENYVILRGGGGRLCSV